MWKSNQALCYVLLTFDPTNLFVDETESKEDSLIRYISLFDSLYTVLH